MQRTAVHLRVTVVFRAAMAVRAYHWYLVPAAKAAAGTHVAAHQPLVLAVLTRDPEFGVVANAHTRAVLYYTVPVARAGFSGTRAFFARRAFPPRVTSTDGFSCPTKTHAACMRASLDLPA